MRKKKIIAKIPHIFIFSLILIGLFTVSEMVNRVYADDPQPDSITANVHGYAWNGIRDDATGTVGGLGWISMNCKEGGTNMTDICANSLYGVSMASSGDLAGHAWASTVGWISFDSADVVDCPIKDSAALDKCTGHIDTTTGAVTGWARIISPPAGGNDGKNGNWNGWIRFSSGNNTYPSPKTDGSGGVTYMTTDPQDHHRLMGYAYAGTIYDTSPEGTDEFGWVSFNSDSAGSSGGGKFEVWVDAGPAQFLNLEASTGGGAPGTSISVLEGDNITLDWFTNPKGYTGFTACEGISSLTTNWAPANPTAWGGALPWVGGATSFAFSPQNTTPLDSITVTATAGTSQTYSIRCRDNSSVSNIATATVKVLPADWCDTHPNDPVCTNILTPSVDVSVTGECTDSTQTANGDAHITWSVDDVNYSQCKSGTWNGSSFTETNWAGTISSSKKSGAVSVSMDAAPSSETYMIRCGADFDSATISHVTQCTTSNTCNDPIAINYTLPKPCEYGDGICHDPEARNQGDPMPCKYTRQFLWFEY